MLSTNRSVEMSNRGSQQQGLSIFEAARRFNVPFNQETLPQSRRIHAGELTFHYLEWGKPDMLPVVLLHGIAQQAHSWDFVSLALSDRYRVIALDARGHGDTQWAADGDYSIEAHQKDLDAFVAAVDLKNFVLIGHSMGGRNGYVYTYRRPENVKALVIVDTGPDTATPGSERIRRFVALSDELDSYDEFVERVRQYTGRPEWMVHGSLQHAITEMPNGKWTWKYDKVIRSPGFVTPTWPREQLWECVKSINCPTKVIRGANSDLFTNETMKKMTDILPRGSSAVVENAGHLVPGDNTRGFLEAIEPFLKDVS